MQPLSPAASEAVAQIAARHGFSVEATQTMLDALIRGGGGMAQFSHPEFSGNGQWMRGGMAMVSDMFNNDLKRWVDALCTDLAELLASRPELLRPGQASRSPMPAAGASSGAGAASTGWPSELGVPSSTGSQNGSRYAVFDVTHRLAVEHDGELTVYDTLDHRIGGVAQQQSGGGASGMRFASQRGPVDLTVLPVVQGEPRAAPASASPAAPTTAVATATAAGPAAGRPADIAATIEKLAELKDKGILSDVEFNAKKGELLARI